MTNVKYRIAILIPSRGFIFSEVLEAVEKIRNVHPQHTFRLFISYDKKIPDSFNELTRQALEWGAECLFYVEEDTVPIPSSFDRLLINDISFIDYGVSGWSCSVKNESGEVLWCGVGCTTVKRKVFEKIEYPWFRTDKTLRLNDWKWVDTKDKQAYGLHDIWFFNKAREAEFKITQVAGECKHLLLESLGRKEVNNGLHIVKCKPIISQYQIISS